MASAVLAPDSFKGSIGAAGVAAALAEGWRSVSPGDEFVLRPMADGGEGTLDAFATAVPGARRMPVTVRGPRGGDVEASWLLLPDGTGVVELASTSGIELLGAERRPWDADTFGFGQAVAAALDAGAVRLVLGIGSSASADGGAGLLAALGARLRGEDGREVSPGLRGLEELAAVDLTGMRALPAGGVTVLSDVTNPLVGPRGAAAVFGPQKGLDAADIARADAALARWATRVGAPAGVPDVPGAGAAGGTGFALLVWGAALVAGSDEVATRVGLSAALAGADVVITGEGSYDAQSAGGKAPAHVAALAGEAGIPVMLAAGRIAPDADLSRFAATASLTDLAGSAEAALADPAEWLRAAGAALAAAHVER